MSFEIILVCDFQPGLTSRMLDVYRFFRVSPQVILVRRGDVPSSYLVDPRPDFELIRVPLPVVGVEESNLLAMLSALIVTIGYLLCIFRVCLSIRRRQTIRLVHALYVFPQGLAGLMLATFLRVPLLITAVGQDVNHAMQRNLLIRTMSCLVLKRAYSTIAVSEPLRRRLLEFGVTNSIYIPTSIDASRTGPSGTSNYRDKILFVGRLTDNKRPLVLIRAFAHVANFEANSSLVICGDGPLRGAVQAEIAERGLASRVKMTRHVTANELDALRSQSGLFVLPSISEGLSLALLEAMAAGQTIIASRNESHLSVLTNGENALLFEPDNPEDLAKQILLAMRDHDLRVKLSRSARSLCEQKFSSSVVATKLEKLYARVILDRLVKYRI